jgi:hypothetical protein
MTHVRAWRWLAVLLLLATRSAHGDEVSPVEVQQMTARFVLAAGANDGGHDRTLLRYAVSDAENFADVMVQMGGVEEANRQMLTDPDIAGFEAALDELSRRVQAARQTRARTEVMLYYSGHADEDGLLLGEQRLGYR